MSRALTSIRQSRFAAFFVVVAAIISVALPCAPQFASAEDAATAPQKIDLTYVPQDAVAAVVIQPKCLLTGPQVEKLPSQMFGFIKSGLGFEPKDVEQAMFLIALPDPAFGPANADPRFASIVKFNDSVDAAQLLAKISADGEETTLEGKKARVSNKLGSLSCVVLDDRTLLISSVANLRWVLTAKKNAGGELCKLLAVADTAPEFQIALAVQPIRPIIQKGLSQNRKLPPALQSLTKIPALADSVVATATKTATGGMQIKITANCANEQSATALEETLKQALETARAMIEAQIKSAPPGKAQPGTIDASNKFLATLQPNRTENRVEIQTEAQSAPAAISVVTALVIPAIQAAREISGRYAAENNLKEIGLAMLNYESSEKHLPAEALYDQSGKPLLSWRVYLLPYFQEDELYKQFHLDEPWDSESNKKLIDKMPTVFEDPRSHLAPGMTQYQAVVGPHCVFEGTEGTKLASITDGTSRTIGVVEVARDKAVPWTKPEDWELDTQNPLKGLADDPGNIFLALFMDGHVQVISRTNDPATLNALFTRNGGEPVNPMNVR